MSSAVGWKKKMQAGVDAGHASAIRKYERWKEVRNAATKKYHQSLKDKAAAGDPDAMAKHAALKARRAEYQRRSRQKRAEAKRLAGAAVKVV